MSCTVGNSRPITGVTSKASYSSRAPEYFKGAFSRLPRSFSVAGCRIVADSGVPREVDNDMIMDDLVGDVRLQNIPMRKEKVPCRL